MPIAETAYLLLGSNLGNRSANLNIARSYITCKCDIIRESSIYETKSWGKNGHPAYFNQVIEIRTRTGPFALLNALKRIEKLMGRKQKGQMMPRLLDIDILYFGNSAFSSKQLTLPHPGIPYRKFTLIPLEELIPDFIDPMSGFTVKEMLEKCLDTGAVRKLAP